MNEIPFPSGFGRLLKRCCRRRVPCVLVTLVALIGGIYFEEDLRGRRAWEDTKRGLEARGAVLNWDAYIPAPLPDDQNIFKAAKMEEWFARQGRNELTRAFGTLYDSAKQANTNVLAEVFIIPPDANIDALSADVVLRYRYSALSRDAPGEPNANARRESEVIPLIVMESVPLTDAITNLARQAGLQYVLDPDVGFRPGGPQPTVSVRWENVTAEQALMAVLSTYNLQWAEDPQGGIARIVINEPSGPRVRIANGVREEIGTLFVKTLSESTASPQVLLHGAQDIWLVSRPLTVQRPLRLVVRSEKLPEVREVSDFFPTNAFAPAIRATGRLRVEPAQSNVFRIFLGAPVYYTAAEYLAWSDQFTNDFALMEEALKRPRARIDGDYFRPLEVSQPNFVIFRLTSQTLAQRAQSFLLSGKPEEALHELTLIHNLCRILDGRRTGGPATLVKAMIDVAVTGIYVEAVKDGLRLRAWRGPQLIALQQQLQEIDLPPQLVAGLQMERAAVCRAFEELGPRNVVQSRLFIFAEPKEPDLWQKLKDARTTLLMLAPRGWVYQNMAVAASLTQPSIDAFEPNIRTIIPQRVDAASAELERLLRHVTPQNFMAAIAVPNFTRAWEYLAKNQTLANEAFVACALERFRQERGDYPANLDVLVPRFAACLPHDIIGGQPLRYRRGADGTFVLYSVGWNGTDEGGVSCPSPNGHHAAGQHGEWVWE